MLTTEEIESFKKEWYSFEEIQRIKQSLERFEKDNKSYDLDEAFFMVDKKVFSKYTTSSKNSFRKFK